MPRAVSDAPLLLFWGGGGEGVGGGSTTVGQREQTKPGIFLGLRIGESGREIVQYNYGQLH